MSENPLGKQVDYPLKYSPELLVGIPRDLNRQKLHLAAEALPFTGADIWNAYELSWLSNKGMPQVAIGRFTFPSDTPHIVESKSLKLYLNSLNQERYENVNTVAQLIKQDLAKVCNATVEIEIALLQPQAEIIEAPDGICLDELELEDCTFECSAELLVLENAQAPFSEVVDEVLYSNLFRSNCPITNQPDWATVTICYQGEKISHAGLLQYLLSYRLHNDFHENCVETIFVDILRLCKPNALTIEANFLRRGGLDINPVRTTQSALNYQNFPRFIRQ